MVRACTARRRIAVLSNRERANLEERRVPGVGGNYALAQTAERVVRDRLPRRLPRKSETAIVGILRTRVSRWDQRQRLAAILEMQVRRHPHQIAKIFRR